MMRPRLVVFLGPPGSGKSHLGELAARRFDLDYVEHEALLLGRWGSREAFIANKAAALDGIEADLRARIGRGHRTVVFESTGLSDRPMLERLATEHPIAIVRVDAPRALCVERVRSRPKGRHFEDDAESAGRFHQFWTRDVAPTWTCDLAVDNDAVAGDAVGIARTQAALDAIGTLLARA